MHPVTRRGAVVWAVARDRRLRRVEVSYALFCMAENATWLSLLVFAFGRGGVREAGAVALVLLLGAVVVTPFAAYAGDRFRPGSALASGYTIQAISMAATGLAMWSNLPMLAYLAALALTISQSFTRPVIGALLPSIVQRPGDLVAANVVVGFLTNLGMFAGPLVAAAILVSGDPEAVFAVFAAALALAAAIVLTAGRDVLVDAGAPDIDAGRLHAQMTAGIRALRTERTITAIIAVLVIAALTLGMLDVLVVTFAEVRLDRGGSAAGVLAASVGLGAVLGSLSATGLIGGTRTTPFLVIGGLAVSLPFLALSGAGALPLAIVLIGLLGFGEGVLTVTGTVAIQRRAPGRLLARIFGVLESLQMLALAVGAALVAVVVDVAGLRSGLLVLGGTLFGLVTIAGLWFVRAGGDAPPPPAPVIERLLADPVFAHLGVAALERIAIGVEEMRFANGDTVVAEGDEGDRYFLVTSGALDVSRDGAHLRPLDPTHSFGEIALLDDVPRTATVRCAADTVLLAIRRDDFLEAVTGHPRSLSTATEIAERLRPDPA